MTTTTESALRRASLSTAETEAVIRDLIRQRDAVVRLCYEKHINISDSETWYSLTIDVDGQEYDYDTEPEVIVAVMRAAGLEGDGGCHSEDQI